MERPFSYTFQPQVKKIFVHLSSKNIFISRYKNLPKYTEEKGEKNQNMNYVKIITPKSIKSIVF